MKILAGAALAAVLVLGACGSDDDDAAFDDLTDVDVSEEFEVVATDLDFTPDRIAVEAGEVTVRIVNDGNIFHDLRVTGADVFLEANAGEQDEATVDLVPGQYTFFCSIPGHRTAGMEGTLEVR